MSFSLNLSEFQDPYLQNVTYKDKNAFMYIKKLTNCLPREECLVYINFFPITNNRVLSTLICLLNACKFSLIQLSLFFHHLYHQYNQNDTELIEGTANYDPWAKINSPTLLVN